jgi:hypothetical protein
MKTDVLTVVKNERDRIEAEVERLNEELRALNVVLNRNTAEDKPMRRTKGPTKDSSGVRYTGSEQRLIDALYALGGSATAREVYNYYLTKFPKEKESKLRSSARQFAFRLAKNGHIDVEAREGNVGSIYSIKK